MEPIAIIGSSCRLPGGVDSPSKLWELLSDPQDVSCTIPSSRFSSEKFHHQNPSQHGQTRVSRSYFISQDVSHFDTEFFGLKPVEAKAIDPQQRLLLEVVYEALESAGLPMEKLEGSSTAVYVGVMSADYETTLLRDPESMPTYAITGIARSMLANRISYVFDWHGPSMTIDTACSASIVAIHQAVQELRSGIGSELAIAAGSNLLLGPEPFIAGSKINMLSPSGYSKMWDEQADGYARGDGIGVLVLKTLKAALRDGDHIESIILETGLNHDGRTKGITMPSTSAQLSLIRQTYERAGLDLNIPEDQCQYFEAHGTGTQAGDPIEAEAIRSAFFTSGHKSGEIEVHKNGTTNGTTNGTSNQRTIRTNGSTASRATNGLETGTAINGSPNGTTNGIQNGVANGMSKPTMNGQSKPSLHVGSIKTVIGHTEGTAGIAGVLKASLAMQHGYIPPNLHFTKLNPKIRPFYEGYLQIPTSLIPWPEVASGKERRASVNSFGFGGTNGHVILESFEHKSLDTTEEEEPGVISWLLGPIVISAATAQSLRLNIEALYAFLQRNPDLSLRNLAWTTQCRRSCLPYRAAFSGFLISTIAAKLGMAVSAPADICEILPSRSRAQPRILAIFTGQGAQWPQMGRELILSSKFISRRLDSLDRRLQSLPLSDRPSWTLRSELLADKATSRMGEAAISQPLITALEILLWDLICAAGVDTSVSAMVGHSGGETAAAYASGYISAEDAICISYYRGLHSRQARDNITGQRGAMIAIESTVGEAEALVNLPHLVGKVCVAAYNSPESITLAGNEDSILSIKETFEEKKKFVRLLKVDNAYHSHHMLSCSAALLKSLRALDIKVTPSPARFKWFSSVLNNDNHHNLADVLKGEYWNQNMVGPVRFSQAVSRAVELHEEFDMAIEIGPHPALKGPTLKTLSQFGDKFTELPYAGLLQRGCSDIESFSDALGLVWKHLGTQAVDFDKFRQVLGENIKPRLLKTLPAYQWSHESYWHESRLSQEYRTNKTPQNELLGSVQPTVMAGQFLWRNFIRLKELPWLSHHSIQGQVVLPAAAYVSMAVDAATAVETRCQPQLIEVSDLKILQALVINDDDAGTEITFELTQVSHSKEFWDAKFTVSAALDRQKLVLMATGALKVTHGASDTTQSIGHPNGLHSLDSELFYSTMEGIGYRYTGPFRSLSSLKANHERASGDILDTPSPIATSTSASVAVLDAAFQSNFLPSYHSGTGRLRTVPVLTGIKMLRLVPRLWSSRYSKLSFNYFASKDLSKDEVVGDLDIYEPDTTSTIVQVQGIMTRSLKAPQTNLLFSKTVWKAADPKLDLVSPPAKSALEVRDIAIDLERVTYFYQRKLHGAVSSGACLLKDPSHQKFIDFIDHTISSVSKGQQTHILNEWTEDHEGQISQILQKYPDNLDAKLIEVVGQHMLDVFRGKTTILEHMLKDDVLNRFYIEALGFTQFNRCLSQTISQIYHRYPNMDILEIGAGTGGATKNILKNLGNSAYSYTFTDISSGFFNKAEQIFIERGASSTIHFKTLDIEKDIADQGFVEHSYDLIVASLVLHATQDLEVTMRNVRRLLKPGGFLVMLEITDNSQTRYGFIFGSLSGWWRSIDGRVHSPCVSVSQWQAILSRTGFSGVDTVASSDNPLAYPFSVIVSQAVDEDILALREPLQVLSPPSSTLTILGDFSLPSSVAKRLDRTLAPYYSDIITSQVTAIDNSACKSQNVIVDVHALNSGLQHDLKSCISSLQRFFASASVLNILWITNRNASGDTCTELAIGIAKSIQLQHPHIQLLCFDIDVIDDLTMAIAANEALNLKENRTQQQTNEALWSAEYDVKVVQGRKLIPRHVPDVSRSGRYHSKHAPVTWRVDLADFDSRQVELKLHKPTGRFYFSSPISYSLQRKTSRNIRPRVTIGVAYSLQTAIFTEFQGSTGNLFLVVGTVLETGQVVVGFCDKQALVVTTWASWIVPWNYELATSATQLSQLGMIIVARSILSNIPRDTTVVVFEPSFLASALAEEAKLRNIELLLLSENPLAKLPETFVSPRTTSRVLQTIFPKESCTALNIGGNRVQFGVIVDNLSDSCQVLDTDNVLSIDSRAYASISARDLTKTLNSASARVAERESSATISIPIESVEVGSISGATAVDLSAKERFRILNWDRGVVPVRARPVDSSDLFLSTVTYWIVGLAPEYSVSICEWMIQNGAKFILIISDQKCEESQIGLLRSRAALIECYDIHEIGCDGLEDLRKTSNSLSFPEVGGVLQASVILPHQEPGSETNSIDSISFSIDVTSHLSKVFQDTPLDFYIVLSSAEVVTGQSTYLPVAHFAAGIVQERRSRNLHASILNISDVYFGESYHQHQKWPGRVGYHPLSEEEFFDALAETIIAGLNTGSDYECTAGVAVTEKNDVTGPTWTKNSRFGHLVYLGQAASTVPEGSESKSGSARNDVKSALLQATTPAEALEIVTDAFTARLGAILHLGSKPERSILARSGDSMGIDSLVAVEIQSWFRDELEVQLPVVEILNSETVGNLLEPFMTSFHKS